MKAELARVKRDNPERYYTEFLSLKRKIDHMYRNEDACEPFELPSYIRPERFQIPEVILAWERENLTAPRPVRPRSLLIVGPTRCGKSDLARYIAHRNGTFSEFTFSEFDTKWYVNGYRNGHVCAVFDNVQRRFLYWREVLHCQNVVHAKGRRLQWGVPSIWVCEFEDQRRWNRSMRECIEGNAVVYEVPENTSLFK